MHSTSPFELIPSILLLASVPFVMSNRIRPVKGDTRYRPPRVFAEQPYHNFRGASNSFDFKPLPTNTNLNFESLPKFTDPASAEKCSAKVRINFLDFDREFGIACLYQSPLSGIFQMDLSVTVDSSEIKLSDALSKAHEVTGFIVREPFSRLHGIISSKGSFYGSVRLFDRYRNRFIVYYIEPAANTQLYNGMPVAEMKGDEPVIFEFIPHHPIPKYNIYDDDEEENHTEDYGNPSHKLKNPTGSSTSTVQNRQGGFESANDLTKGQNKTPSTNETSRVGKIMHQINIFSVGNSSVNGRNKPRHKELQNPEELVSSDAAELSKNETSLNRQKRALKVKTLRFADIDEEVAFSSSRDDAAGDMFDLSVSPQSRATSCDLCIWIDEQFAQQFSLGTSDQIVSIVEIIDIISELDWTFRSLDLNGDAVPELISFKIVSLVVSELTGIPYEDHDSLNYVVYTDALEFLKSNFPARDEKSCCARIGFLNTPFVNFARGATNLRGLCDWNSNNNIGIVSGSTISPNNGAIIKLGRYDVQRALLHLLGHLFGSGHDDDVTEYSCQSLLEDEKAEEQHQDYGDDDAPTPGIMDSNPEVNIGLRPNSLRFSSCAKALMAIFVSSVPPGCLIKEANTEPFCGNGIVEEGEECDYGAMWQCVESSRLYDGCLCGMRDSIRPCRFPLTTPEEVALKCPKRPLQW